MAVKMNLRIITKNHATDSEIGFLAKSISKSNGCATAMPTAWELKVEPTVFKIKFQFEIIKFWENVLNVNRCQLLARSTPCPILKFHPNDISIRKRKNFHLTSPDTCAHQKGSPY